MVGAFTNAMAIQDPRMEKRISTWIGGMWESAVGQGQLLLWQCGATSTTHVIYPRAAGFLKTIFLPLKLSFQEKENSPYR